MSARAWVLFAGMSIMWGIPYLMIKVAVDGVSVPVLVLARTAGGAAILLPLTLSRPAWAAVLRHWKPVLVFAAIEITIPWFLLADAERHLTSSMTGLLIAASPIIAATLDRFTGGERRLGLKRSLGLGIGLAGVAVLAGHDLSGGNPWPILEVLLVSTCYAFGAWIAGRWLADVPALPMTAACLGLAALVYIGPAAATWPQHLPAPPVLWALAGLAVISTAVAFVVFFALVREIGAPRTLVITYINPAVALLAGVVVLGEPMTPWHLAGLALILGGSMLATRRADRQSDEDTVEAAGVGTR